MPPLHIDGAKANWLLFSLFSIRFIWLVVDTFEMRIFQVIVNTQSVSINHLL